MLTESSLAVDLLCDGSLTLEVAESLVPLVAPWLPADRQVRSAQVRSAKPRAAASIVVYEEDAAAQSRDDDAASLVLTLNGVRAHAGADGAIMLHGDTTRGVLLPTRRVARIAVGPRRDARAMEEMEAMLTIAAALLIGRAGGALVHGAAVVDDDGAAWLLPGDSHAGKSTTCVSLVHAGWRYLSDDQVVLRRDRAGTITAEGWPRVPNLDAGWSSGQVSGRRVPFAMGERWPDRRLPAAPLRGVILPMVHASLPTRAVRCSAMDALAMLVRQSPWLLADADACEAVLVLLADVVRGDVLSLSLGVDSYARGEVIADRLAEALRHTP